MDMTLYYEAADKCWAFKPHSGKADAFLKYQFTLIGDRDLGTQDIELIVRRAARKGLKINNQGWYC